MATIKETDTKTTPTDVKADVEVVAPKPKAKPNVKVKQTELKPNDFITVKSGFNGRLIYVSKRTGEVFTWDEFGSEQEMELLELRNAKNASKDFFINNWFLFDNPSVIEYLGVSKLYEHALNTDAFEELFKKDPAEVKSIIGSLSKGQKQTVIYRAKQLIESKELDSLGVINALEEVLNTQLIERD